MAEMDEYDFADMVEQTPVTTYIIEYREPSANGVPGKLIGACLTDRQSDGLSMVYSFYDPDSALGPSGWRPREVDDSEAGLPPMPGGLKFPKI